MDFTRSVLSTITDSELKTNLHLFKESWIVDNKNKLKGLSSCKINLAIMVSQDFRLPSASVTKLNISYHWHAVVA